MNTLNECIPNEQAKGDGDKENSLRLYDFVMKLMWNSTKDKTNLSRLRDGLIQSCSSLFHICFKMCIQFVCGLEFLPDVFTLQWTDLHQLRARFVHLVYVRLMLCYQLPQLLKVKIHNLKRICKNAYISV